MARKMKDPVAKYFGTPEEIAELKAKHLRGECLTLDETSKVMGLSRSAIRAIELRALAKLRKALMKQGLNGVDDFFDTGRDRRAVGRGSVDGD